MVVPPTVRSALVEHAQAESPNEACGVVVFKDGRAERYIPGANLSESPYRYELQVPPETHSIHCFLTSFMQGMSYQETDIDFL